MTTEHKALPEYFRGMPELPSISETIFEISDGTLVFEQLLAKNLQWSGFSPSENLIELYDTNTGGRLLIDTKDFFRIPCPAHFSLEFELGKQFNIRTYEAFPYEGSETVCYQVNSVYTAELKEFRPRIFRKRHYLQAVLVTIPDSKRDLYRTRPYNKHNPLAEVTIPS